MTKQLNLQFQNEVNSYLEEDFLALAENSAARNFLQKFFTQKNSSSDHLQSLILKGEEASGKTHLLHIFAEKFAAEFLIKEEIFTKNLADFFQPNRFYILEDFHQIADEEALLHLFNSLREAGAFLLLSARNSDKKFKLKDLNSRLKNIPTVTIENPSKEALEALLMNRFARRQIRPSKSLIKSILSEVGGSYAALNERMKREFV
ncbi:MAG: hypothetical protein KGP29_01775 [Proteobacteria bacterium]|nr:hypothetical protein [Pseudomonadota bacterium]